MPVKLAVGHERADRPYSPLGVPGDSDQRVGITAPMKQTLRACLGLCLSILTLSRLALAEPLPVPEEIEAVMNKPRYAEATWSLLVIDVDSGEEFYPLNEDKLSFTGSTRKLFSVGLALLTLGPDHRFTTRVYRRGEIDQTGTLKGDLVLVAAGDLVFGGRRIDNDTVEVTDLDHNDANNLGTAVLPPQDPLYALKSLAEQVKADGIQRVTGEIVIDDRLFESYRVPNQNLLITPMMLNENQIDVTLRPTKPGQNAELSYRPQTGFFKIENQATTGDPGSEDTVEFSGNRLTSGVGSTGTVTGSLPSDYSAALNGQKSYVGTFRVEEPNAFARTAFIEVLEQAGVEIEANALVPHSSENLSLKDPEVTEVASYTSAPYDQVAKLVLKVSLNLGANLSLSLFGLEQGERTIDGALSAERKVLSGKYGIDPSLFRFPTNGSGSPDSEAAPRALAQWLATVRKTDVGSTFQKALPVMGVDGSLSETGKELSGKGRVFAKTGTTVGPGPDGKPHLIAQCLAGYIETRGGRRVAYALMVNNAGPLKQIVDVTEVFEDQAVISNIIYESL